MTISLDDDFEYALCVNIHLCNYHPLAVIVNILHEGADLHSTLLVSSMSYSMGSSITF